MEVFQRLGSEIEQAWCERNYNEDIFPEIAADALRNADLLSKVSAWDAVEWAIKQSELPQQKDPNGNFGDPPITLFVGRRFYIDIYFWLNGTTEIHQHAFSGAFQVLLGSSLHSWYDFEQTEKVNLTIELGSMKLKQCELLQLGNVKEIRAGRQYIHSLFHLDQPSATVVVRTDTIPAYKPQFSYYKPSVALDPFSEHQTTTRHLQIVKALYQAPHPDADRLVGELLKSSDFHTSFLVLSVARDFLVGTPMGQLFNLEQPAQRFETLMEIVRGRHGSKVDGLAAVFAHRDRSFELAKRRSYVTDPEHRFFFALMMNVEGRENVFKLIRDRYPNADPISKILDWAYDLAQTRVVGVNTTNALGIEGFDDQDLSLLEHLLQGKTDAEVREVVIAEYGTERLGAVDLDGKIERIRTSTTFLPLMTE